MSKEKNINFFDRIRDTVKYDAEPKLDDLMSESLNSLQNAENQYGKKIDMGYEGFSTYKKEPKKEKTLAESILRQ